MATGVEKLDPTRGRQVLLALVQLCTPNVRRGDNEPDVDTSFSVCARLYALQVSDLEHQEINAGIQLSWSVL